MLDSVLQEPSRQPEPPIPEGVVTLLLADLEQSTSLWERHSEAMRAALGDLDSLVDEIRARHRGIRPRDQGEGDSFLLAFARPTEGLACAWALREAFASRSWPAGLRLRFRMALHAGELEKRSDGRYAGSALARCARVRDLAHGGQVLLTGALHGLVVDALPAGTRVGEQGTHPLRGLSRPERVLELFGDAEETRALRAVDEAGPDLPPETSALIGRESEYAALLAQLEQSALVTLIGAGGSGKTRLALRLAHDHAERHPDGAHWVDLAALRDGALVATAVASATGAGELSARTPLADLTHHLARRRALVVLDNCEHLIEACAEIARELLAHCPHLRLLATSREPMALEGETSFRVPSLALPPEGADADEVGRYAAVRLLVERGVRAHAGFGLTEANAAAIAGICRRLDGLPLALELAAARLRVLSPEQVLRALADRFRLLTGGTRTALARQRTLEASVEWSYGLLGEEEQAVLRRLAVFPGSFDLAAAEAVCADEGLDAYLVLDLLTRLVDRSLVGVEVSGAAARYTLLETIRAYGRHRLDERGEAAAVRRRHLRHTTRLLAGLRPSLESGDPRPALARVEAELANVRAAHDWAVDSGQAAEAIAIIESSQGFWAMRGLHPEGIERLETALEAEELDGATRARGYVTAASFAARVGEFGAAVRFAAPGLELARDGADRETLCDALVQWGWASRDAGTATGEACLAALEEARALAEELGDPIRRWQALNYHAIVSGLSGSEDLGRAVSRMEEVHRLAQEIGAPPLVAFSRLGLAVGYRCLLRLEEAREWATLVLQSCDGLLFGPIVAFAHTELGMIEMLSGTLDAAAEHLELATQASFISGRRIRAELDQGDLSHAELAYHRGERREARERLEEGIAGARDRGNAHALCSCLHLAGLLELEAGDHAGARRRLEEASGLARAVPYRVWLGRVELGLAYVARLEGELEAAWSHAHEALEISAVVSGPDVVAVALEELGGLAAGRGRAELGARLLGAADRMLSDFPGVRRPIERAARLHALEGVRSALGAEAFEAAFEQGRGLSEAEAVDLARRGRGRRSRPIAGWDSLTPAELEVARLVAQGLANAAAAKRLFVSINTVKRHLANAYGKLGISSRAELAAEVARKEKL